MPDGDHIVFQNEVDSRAWVIGADGNGLRCLTCTWADDPGPKMGGGLFFVEPFPDQKRLLEGTSQFVSYGSGGAAAAYGLDWLGALTGTPVGNGSAAQEGAVFVVECEPSILDCRDHEVLPVDMSADANPTEPVGQRRTFHLSPDGQHLLWMDVRPDGTVLVLAKLVREPDRYVAVDARVLNPPSPTGPDDPRPDHWVSVGQTFEGKSFADGGRKVEYLGGSSMDNFDVETVDLATGARQRLTSAPDWDEDGAISPDGRYLVTASWRTMRRIDVLGGMLPELHAYIDLPFMSAIVANYVSSHTGFQCDLTPWLLDSSGDHGGALLGQPLAPYAGGESYVANDLEGAPIWSPDGTKVLLQERIYGPAQGSGTVQSVLGSVPSRLSIAQLDVRPAKPLPVASSDVGSWAPSARTFNTGFDRPAHVTIPGKAAGTATLTYTGNILSSADSVTYTHFSDDGETFADGTETIDNPQILTTPVSLNADITISGAHRGFFRANLTAGEGAGQTPSGMVESELDGMQRSGLPKAGACPASMPHPVPLSVHSTVHRRGRGIRIVVRVSASIAGAGMNEAAFDTRPVRGAVVSLAGTRKRTSAGGRAVFTLRDRSGGRRYRLRASAGDTFEPARASVRIPGPGGGR